MWLYREPSLRRKFQDLDRVRASSRARKGEEDKSVIVSMCVAGQAGRQGKMRYTPGTSRKGGTKSASQRCEL